QTPSYTGLPPPPTDPNAASTRTCPHNTPATARCLPPRSTKYSAAHSPPTRPQPMAPHPPRPPQPPKIPDASSHHPFHHPIPTGTLRLATNPDGIPTTPVRTPGYPGVA